MRTRPPRYTSTDTLCPYTALFRSNKSFRTQTVERGHDRLAARSGIAHKILDRQPLAKIILRANHSANEKIVNFILLVHSNCLQLWRSEEHTSEIQSLMRNSYAVFCLK